MDSRAPTILHINVYERLERSVAFNAVSFEGRFADSKPPFSNQILPELTNKPWLFLQLWLFSINAGFVIWNAPLRFSVSPSGSPKQFGRRKGPFCTRKNRAHERWYDKRHGDTGLRHVEGRKLDDPKRSGRPIVIQESRSNF